MTDGKKRILVVEDEAVIGLAQQAALEHRGYSVAVALKGEEAVERTLADPSFDLVLMDIDLGTGIDGPEAARRILAERDLPIVFLSSHTEPELVARTEQVSSYGYVVKNTGIAVLDASIKMAFRLADAREKESEKDEALRSSLETAADIVERIPSGLFIYKFTPPDSLVLEDANPQAERLTGVLLREWRGREFDDIWPAARERGLTERYLAALRGGGPYETEELAYEDGRLSGVYHISAFPLPSMRLAVAFEDVTERVRSEVQLRESESFHRKVLETALDGFWLVDTRGRFLEVNEAYCRMSGYSEQELLSMSISDVEAEEGPAETAEHMARLLSLGRERFETRHRRKDGAVYDLEVSALSDPVVRGRVFAFLRDVTEAKRAAEARRLSEERLRLANRATNDVVWDWDIVEDSQYWNEAGRTVFGWSEIVDGPVPARWWLERVHPADRERVDRGFYDVVSDPAAESWRDEYRFLKADGSYATVLDRGFVLRDSGGRAVRMIAAMLDITEGERAERELRKSEEMFRQLAESIKEALWLGSPDWAEIHYISPAYASIWGRDPAELYARPMAWLDSVVEEDRAKVQAAIPKGGGAAPAPILFPDYRIRRPDGSVAWISARAFPLVDSDGHPYRIAGIAEDVTERRRAEDLVRERLREKEVLLREVHHRIKNNFGTVLSLLSVQAHGVEEPSARGRLLEAVGQIEGMRQIYEKLLKAEDYANLSSKAYLEDLAVSVMGIFGESRGISLDLDIADFPLPVGAAFPLGTILNELLTNSMKYAFAGRRSGKIAVDFAREDGRARLSVSDDGPGLPPDLASSSSAGFGLMLVRMLAEQLDGSLSIECRSAEPDGSAGARVSVEFRA